MRRTWTTRFGVSGCVLLASAFATPVSGASHLWRFNEIFSNADGSIMYIEMKECCGAPNETFLAQKWIRSDATGVQFTFPSNLPCTDCTANEFLLLATQGFADLPGAPTPDFIIPSDFFSTGPDTLRYWMYSAATVSYGVNAVPTDGSMALHFHGTAVSVGPNSPTNFAGQSGSIITPCSPADVAVDGAVDVNDLIAVINSWGPCAGPCAADFMPGGGDNQVNVDDLVGVISAWGVCP